MERPIYQGKAPYQLYSIGQPYYHAKDKRFYICAWLKGGTPKDRVRTAYARYLMEIHLGRYLGMSEHVHHKDENPLNDVLSNLEILPQGVHKALHRRSVYFQQPLEVTCMCCGSPFYMSPRQLRAFNQNITKVKTVGPFCSHSCVMKVVRGSVKRRDTFSFKKVVPIK